MEKISSIYSSINGDIVDRRDCCVRSFSIVLEKPYSEVHAVCAKYGRRKNSGMYDVQQRDVAKEYGMTPVKVYGISPNGNPTVLQFIKAFPKGRYYVARSGHAFAIIDGVIHDWKSGTGIRSRIIRAFKAD